MQLRTKEIRWEVEILAELLAMRRIGPEAKLQEDEREERWSDHLPLELRVTPR